MNLKDFKPREPDFEDDETLENGTDTEIESTGYHSEITTLKIDKLSNRVTIISVILPCIIGAILIFAYLDMKERVVDVDQTKNTQVERISKQVEEKINALEIKIAKNRFDLDKGLPDISGKQLALEGMLAKFDTSKADDKTIKALIKKLDKQVASNSKREKALEKQLSQFKARLDKTIASNAAQMGKNLTGFKEEIKLFKEEFDARLLELSDYELQIGELRKNYSLMDKKVRSFEQDTVSKNLLESKTGELNTFVSNKISKLETQLTALNKKLAANISRLQKDIDLMIQQSSSSSGPKPQINIDAQESTNTIEQKSLTE